MRCDVATVAITGQGVDELRAAIRAELGCHDLITPRPLAWTDRQRDVLRKVLSGAGTLSDIF